MSEIQQALYQATCFYEDAERYKHNIEFPELQFSKGTRNYSLILSRLERLNLPNPLSFTYTSLSLEELQEYLTTLLTKVLGSDYLPQIREYNSLLKLEQIENPFDSVLNVDLIDDQPTIKHIHISDKVSSIQVASTAHEYIHALLTKYSTFDYNRVLSNIHYKELLSILIEYIIIYELSQLLKEDKLREKHNIIRLHTNKEHSLEHKSCAELSKQLEILPYMLRNQYKLYVAYENHTSFGYITSDIYATRLFEYFQDDPKTLLQFMKRIIEGEKSIKELLRHYNIALNNPDTFITYNKRLDNIPKL